MDVARLNFSHGDVRRPRGQLQAGSRRLRSNRARRRYARRPAGPQDPTRPLRRRSHVLGER